MSRHTGVANWARPAASERADHHGHRCARARPARDRTASLACLLKVDRRDPTKDANRNFGSLPTTRRRSLALYSTPVVYRKGLQRCCAEWVPALPHVIRLQSFDWSRATGWEEPREVVTADGFAAPGRRPTKEGILIRFFRWRYGLSLRCVRVTEHPPPTATLVAVHAGRQRVTNDPRQ